MFIHSTFLPLRGEGIFFFLCGQKEETRKNREHAPAIVRPANTSPLVVADLQSGFDNDLLFFSDRFELAKLELS